MCSIRYYIDERTKKEQKNVIIRVNHAGKSFKKSSGVKLSLEDWDKTTGFPKDKTSDEFKELATLESTILKEIYPTIKELLGRSPNINELRDAYDAHMDASVEKTDSFRITDLIQSFIDNKKGIYSNSAIRHYERLKELVLEKYGGSIYDNIHSLDKKWVMGFVNYLVSEDDLQYQNSTIKVFLKKLISVLNFHDINVTFKVADVMKGFKDSKSVNEDKPYLTIKQINNIADFVIDNNDYENFGIEWKVMDLCVWCANTGMRFNEAIEVTTGMIKGDVITYTTSKNNKKITVPLPKICKEMAISDGKLFEGITNSKANTVLTKILKDYGMNNTRTIVRFSGRNKEVKEKSLADLISLHSMRRSYISNLLDNGVPIKDITMLTGISMSTLINYYSSSDKETVFSNVLKVLNR